MGSIFRIYPSRSNTIASGNFASFNSGQNAVSELWYGGGGAGAKKNSISRFIMKFDLTDLQYKINQKDINLSNITSIKLKMTNAIPRDKVLCPEKGDIILNKAIAASFDLVCFPINKEWDEGRGYDMVQEAFVVKQAGNPLISGYSNWNSATSLENWNFPGIYENPAIDSGILQYTGNTNFKGLELTKTGATTPTTYQFDIFSSTTLNTNLSATTIGNDTTIYFNPNSGSTTAITNTNNSVLNSFVGTTSVPANTSLIVHHNLNSPVIFAQVIDTVSDELLLFSEISGYTDNSFVYKTSNALSSAKFVVFGGQKSGTTNIDEFSITTGVTANNSFTVNHNLGTKSVYVSLVDTDTDEVVYALVSGYTNNSVQVKSNVTVPNLKINVFGGSGTAIGNSVSYYSEVVSLVGNVDKIIQHDLGTSDITIEVVDVDSNEKIYTDVLNYTTTSVTINSTTNVNAVRVNVMGQGVGTTTTSLLANKDVHANTTVFTNYSETINITGGTPFVVNHNLGSNIIFTQAIDTINNELLLFPDIYNYTNNAFTFSANTNINGVKFVVLAGQESGTTNIDAFNLTTGLTANTPLTINHNLGTDNIYVKLTDITTDEEVFALVSGYTTNSVEIKSNVNVDNIKVGIFGGSGPTTGDSVSYVTKIVDLTANTPTRIIHNLGTYCVGVEAIDLTTNELIILDTTEFLSNSVDITSSINISNVQINIIGDGAGSSISTTTYYPTTSEISTLLQNNSEFSGLGVELGSGTSQTILPNDKFALSATTAVSGFTSSALCSSQHFPIGDENINMDIQNLVLSWLDGSRDNNGVGIAYKREYELISGNTRFVSSFFTEKTNTAWKPYIEISYNQTIKDDRKNVTNNRVSKLFLYTFSGNNFVNYYSAGTVTIKNSTGADFITGLIPQQLQKGVYYVEVNMSSAQRGQIYKDVWNDITFVPGMDKQSITQTFQIQDNFFTNPLQAPQVNEYSLSTYGIDDNSIISNDELLKVFVDLRVNYSTKTPITPYDVKYRMVMNNQETVIPWTSISQAIINKKKSNFFTIDTSWLLHNQQYQIQFKINEFGTNRIVTGEEINFRVMREF